MKIVVACGGTGGHAFPGLAVAKELLSRGHEVMVWTSGREIESSVLKGWEGEVFATGAKQLKLLNAISIVRSIRRCKREIKAFKPDVMLAMGSYSSLPPVLAAKSAGIPVVLHEANTVPGRAVEFLSMVANAVAISFAVTSKYLPKATTVLTGLPVRSSIASGRRFDFIPKDAFVVFITGGSQGAHAVNLLMKEAIELTFDELKERGSLKRQFYVIHQTGVADELQIAASYREHGVPSRVHAFETEMANAFASADMVVARAGASTCFEIAVCGKPSLLIPLPSSMRNHQHFNAEAFATLGAADEGIQSDLNPKQLSHYLLERYDHPERLTDMAAKVKGLACPDAAAKVADLVEHQVKDFNGKI